MLTRKKPKQPVRYAVVGLGHFAQSAILPAFAGAKNSQLAALVSGDGDKRKALAKRYGVALHADYEGLETLMATGELDAVYVSVPNAMHLDFTLRAAAAGMHVLCEKPLAVTVAECKQMIEACRRAKVKLMCAYRLHFERATLTAQHVVRSGALGEPRIFCATFTQQTDASNSRFEAESKGGGPLYDVGVYCLNAARMLFDAEPIEVSAFLSPRRLGRDGVEEQATAMLRFPGERLATFAVSFVAHQVGRYQLVGTRGAVTGDPGFSHSKPQAQEVTRGNRTTRKVFPKRDQVAAELLAFSQCVLTDTEPEPSGDEGMRDVRVIEALFASARQRKPITLPPMRPKAKRADLRQEKFVKLQPAPALIDAQPPAKG